MQPNTMQPTDHPPSSPTVTLLHKRPNLSIFHKPAGMPITGNKPHTLQRTLNLPTAKPILSVPRPLSGPALITTTKLPYTSFTFFAIVHSTPDLPTIPTVSITHLYNTPSTAGPLSVLHLTAATPGHGLKKLLSRAGIPAVGTTAHTKTTSCATRAVYIACVRVNIPSFDIDVSIPRPPNFETFLQREHRFATSRLTRVEKMLVVDTEQGTRFLDRIFYTAGTMSPRESTELIASTAALWMKRCQHVPSLLDLGTGCAAILISAILESGNGVGVGVDNSLPAVYTARRNVVQHDLKNTTILHADFGTLADIGLFDVVVSNPPYLTQSEICNDVAFFENDPQAALLAGVDGLDAYRTIAKIVGNFLVPSGVLVLEIGARRDPAVVRALFESVGLRFVDLIKDFRGFDRCLVLRNAG